MIGEANVIAMFSGVQRCSGGDETGNRLAGERIEVEAGPLAVCADVDAFASLEGVAANAKASALVA